MSAPTAFVDVELHGRMHRVGILWTARDKGRDSATFEYHDSWLSNPHRFALEPALQLHPGPYHTRNAQSIFGALGDSAPDRWGRTLIARAERNSARAEKRAMRSLGEADYLLAVNDELRQGALRFAAVEAGPYLSQAAVGRSVPPLVSLTRLLSAADHVQRDEETHDDLALLLAPGGSLGGARPKASVTDKGELLIAKFPSAQDPHDTVGWEYVALLIANSAGVSTPKAIMKKVGRRNVLITHRFDRLGSSRVPFLSAMSALGALDNEVHSYMEIADALRRTGAAPADDLEQLWRRIVLNVLISNGDDHLLNHAFLYKGRNGWRLSPAYDLNPVPTHIRPRGMSTAIADDFDLSASLELAQRAAQHFGVKPNAAKRMIGEVRRATRRWRQLAKRVGLGNAEMEVIASAFEHEDAAYADTLV